MFHASEGFAEIRELAKRDGVTLPENCREDPWKDTGEDWWMDEYCHAVRDLMFAIRDGSSNAGEKLDEFTKKWYNNENANDSKEEQSNGNGTRNENTGTTG
jgi:hypothetical protein